MLFYSFCIFHVMFSTFFFPGGGGGGGVFAIPEDAHECACPFYIRDKTNYDYHSIKKN